jgi:predicted nucleic acid-binding protein
VRSSRSSAAIAAAPEIVPSLLVPDASVIVKWTLPGGAEPAAERALGVLAEWQAGEVDLVVPSLWRYEVANVLARKAPRNAVDLLEGLLALDLPTVDLDTNLLGEALNIALRSTMPPITPSRSASVARFSRRRGLLSSHQASRRDRASAALISGIWSASRGSGPPHQQAGTVPG